MLLILILGSVFGGTYKSRIGVVAQDPGDLGRDLQARLAARGAWASGGCPRIPRSISSQLAQQVLNSTGNVSGENFQVDGRWYRLARSPVQVSNDQLGTFAVILPLDFVIQPGTMTRNNSILLYALAMIGVVAVGYGISRLITNPLFKLVHTSQAIAGGGPQPRRGGRRAGARPRCTTRACPCPRRARPRAARGR